MSSFTILPKTSSYNEFIIFPETTYSFFEARNTELKDQMSEQEKSKAQNIYQELYKNLKEQLSEQEKIEALELHQELCQQLKEQHKTEQKKNTELETRITELEARNTELEARNMELEARNMELDARNMELDARNMELEEKLQIKDKFILDYWEKMNNLLIAERKNKKELEIKLVEFETCNAELNGRNAELKRDLDWYHKQCARERSCATELPAVNW